MRMGENRILLRQTEAFAQLSSFKQSLTGKRGSPMTQSSLTTLINLDYVIHCDDLLTEYTLDLMLFKANMQSTH